MKHNYQIRIALIPIGACSTQRMFSYVYVVFLFKFRTAVYRSGLVNTRGEVNISSLACLTQQGETLYLLRAFAQKTLIFGRQKDLKCHPLFYKCRERALTDAFYLLPPRNKH